MDIGLTEPGDSADRVAPAPPVQPPEPVEAAAIIEPPLVQVAGKIHHLALVVLALIAVIFALSWAQDFVVPLLFGIVTSYTLTPLVNWIEEHRVPRAIATVIVMVSVIGAGALGAYALRGQVQTIIEQLPEAASRFARSVARMELSRTGNLQKIQSAATQVEKATTPTPPSAETGGTVSRPATVVIVEQPKFKLGDFLWQRSMEALRALGQLGMVLFLVFFLLLGGDTFKRKLVRLAGPTMSKRKITVRILDDINGSIQKFMLILLSTNLLVALLTWIAFRWIGLDNAGAWAAGAGLLHLIPYLGPAVTAIVTGMAAFMQFESFAMAFLVAGASLAIATLVGVFITTWMTGRMARMNSASVFVSLLFWGWLWGVWGMLLSIPIVVIVKVVSEHIEQLHSVAELLRE